MRKLKEKKYLALLLIAFITIGLIGLVSLGLTDKYKGLVKVNNANVTSKLLSSTGALLDENDVKGNCTVEYTVKFTLEEVEGLETRNAIIKASLSDEESVYARFKNISKAGVSSEISNNGKDIDIEIENVPLGEEREIKLKLILEGAPNGFTVKPNIRVQEKTGEDRYIDVEEIVVNTNTLTGTVNDENDFPVNNIEVLVKKNGQEVKRTYTNEDGRYTITDLEIGTYEVDIDEETYELVGQEIIDVEGSSEANLSVRTVDPYEIETHKYIEKIKLVIDGEEKEFTYDDATEVVESIKRANTISGEIEYKIEVQNVGEKSGTITKIEDVGSEGLKLKEGSIGWEEEDGILYYRPLEGATLIPQEKREVGLVLEIESTEAAKTYINKITANGELYEKVVYILDGVKYKELELVEGEKLEEEVIEDDNFSGWYTDRNKTNKYNFDLPVTKNLILYGSTEATKFNVKFIKDGEVVEELIVNKNDRVEPIEGPDKVGYDFKHWSLTINGEPFDFSTRITDDTELYAVYEIKKFQIKFIDQGTEYATKTVNYNDQIPISEITDPEREHYRFKYWSLTTSGMAYDMTTPVTTNVTLYSVYEIIKYNVKFIDEGIVVRDEDVDSGSIIQSVEVSKRGYTFKYWRDEDNAEFNFNTPIMRDIVLTSIYEINTYEIGYDYDGGSATNPTTYTVETDTFTLNNPTKEGYEFVGWTGSNGTTPSTTVRIEKGTVDNKNYTANYRPISYRITYNLNGGSLEEGKSNPENYTIESSDITLNNPSKTGYTFIGWTGSNGDTPSENVTIPSGSTGEKSYVANYLINTYNVEFYDNDALFNTMQVEYQGTINTEEILYPTKEGYNFTYWSLKNITSGYDFSVPITDNIKLYSNYVIQEKEVIFNDENRITRVSVNWGETVNPIDNQGKRGYSFKFWSKDRTNEFDFSSTITEPTTLYAMYEIVTYPIRYDLAGGTVSSNPDSYTVETDTFTLNNPTKTAYDFAGWTGTDITGSQKTVTIEKGSIGERSYTATYTPIDYSITYKLNGGSLEEGKTNPETYNIETPDFTLNNPSKTGYTFIGWTEGSEEPANPKTITTGTYGNKTINANYTINQYTVTYMNEGNKYYEDVVDYNELTTKPNDPSKTGYTFKHWSLAEGGEAFIFDTPITDNITLYAVYEINVYEVSYMNEGQRFYLDEVEYNNKTAAPSEDPEKEGYTFKRWSLTPNGEAFNFETLITEDTTLYAVYEINHYTVTFVNEGAQYGDIQNVDYHQKATKPNTDPEKVGYTFKHWSLTQGGLEYDFNTLITDNIVLYSVYEINTYKVLFMDGTNKFYEEDIDYNEKATIPSNTPTKAHNIFVAWTLNNTAYDFNTPVTSNITLYSSYEEVVAPTITHTPTEWTRGPVTVTINSSHDDYSYYYNVDGGQNRLYEDVFEVSQNGVVNAYSVKNNISSVETSHNIDNIDIINPTIVSLTNTGVTPVTATININMKDDESGLYTYKVYKDNVLVYTREAISENIHTYEEEYTVTNLEEISDYTIKVEVYDRVGNVSEDEITVTTPAKHYVARIIGMDNTPYEESQYIKFETLKEAIEYNNTETGENCISRQCTIQMIDNTEESNNVSSGQDITLDINGYTISGVTESTINNNGKLIIIDTADEPGKIYSATGVGIYNTNIVELGINELPPNQQVSKVQPVVEGYQYGIHSNTTDETKGIHFYDGKIIGIVAVKGDVTDTPYLYNTTVKDDTTINKQVETLTQLAEAEARIRSTYYTKVQGGVDESKNGSYEDIDYTKPIIQQTRSDSEYRFVYDESTGKLQNTNNNRYRDYNNNITALAGTTAHSYVKIDLTNYDEPQMLTINAEQDAYYYYYCYSGCTNNSNYGYVYITDSPDMPDITSDENLMFKIEASKAATDYTKLLENGKEYYVHFLFHIKTQVDYNKPELFSINDIYIGNYKPTYLSDLQDATLFSDTGYPFVKNENNELYNSNARVDRSSAHSFMVIDLTNVSEQKYLLMKARVNSGSGYSYGYVTVKNNSDMPSMNDKEGRAIYISGNIGDKYYPVKLIPNEINYIHLCYARTGTGASNPDSFIISSIETAKNSFDYESVDMVPNGDYYFVPNGAGGYENNNAWVDYSTAHSYFEYDLTNVAEDVDLNFNLTISSESNCDIGYITVTDNPTAPEYSDTTGRFVYLSGESSGNYTVTLTAGRVNYVHVGYRKDGSIGRGNDKFTINYIGTIDSSGEEYPVETLDGITRIGTATYNVPVLNQNVDTVQILRNITLTNPLEIVETRDVILDLNGYTLTTSKDDYVIKNKGSLKIIDSKYDSDIEQSDADYEADVIRYETEYQRISGAAAEYTSDLQDQYDAEYDAAYAAYIAAGGEPDAETKTIPSTTDYFDVTDASGYGSNPIVVWRSYANTQTLILYKEQVNSKSYSSVSGRLTLYDNYYPGYMGDCYIGFSTSNEKRIDDFVTYEHYEIDTPSGKTYDYNIPTPDEAGNYYLKIVVVHASQPSGYDVSFRLDSMTLTSPKPIRKDASEKTIENANNIYSVNDYNARGLLAMFDGLNPGSTENVWEDISSNGNNFSLQDVTYKDNGMYFDGSNSYATINTPIVTGNNETVELLIKPLNTNNQVIYLGDSNEKIEFGVYSGYIIVGTTSTYTFNLPSDYADGKIKHIAITYDNDDYEVYYNGTKLEKRSNKDYWGTLSNTRLGRDGGSGSKYNGYIYGVKVYNRSLGSDEITLNYNVDVARYNFGEFKHATAVKNEAVLTGNISSTTGSVIFNDFDSYLDIDTGKIILNKAGSYNVITNKGRLTIGEQGIVSGLSDSNRGIYNTETGDILEGQGTISMTSSNNIGILNDGVNEDEIKGYKLENTSSNSKNIHNRSINDLVLSNIISNGEGLDIYQETNSNLTVKNSVLNSKSNESFYSNESSVPSTITFNNSTINNRIYNRSNSYRTININNSTLGGTRGSNVYNYIGVVNINKSNLTHTEWNVENYGTLNINDSNLTANHHSITNGYDDYYAPCRGTMNIVDTDIVSQGTSNTNTIYNYGTMVIDGGSLTNNNTNSTGVFSGSCYYNGNNPELTIKGDFNTNENYTTGVGINYGKLTLGEDDDEVSEENPLIQATTNAIAINVSKNTIPEFNYYDGELVGQVNASINGHITDVPDNYDLYITKGETLENVILRPNNYDPEEGDYVARIGNTKYATLQGAINAVPSNTETEIVLLKNIEAANTITISDDKNIILNMDNYHIKEYNEETGFINNGTLKIYNGELSDDAYIVGYSKKLMINNGTLTYDKIKTYQLRTYQILIENNDTLTFDNSKAYSEIDYSYNLTTEIINNKGTMTATDSEIYTRSTYVMRNSGTLTMTNGKLMTTAWISGGTTYDVWITNEETGIVTLNNVYYEKEDGDAHPGYAGLENYGTIYVNGGSANLKDYLSNNGGRYPSLFAYNYNGGNIYIKDTEFVSSRAYIIQNAGYAKLDNITSYFWNGFSNSGTMDVVDSDIEAVNAGTCSNSGTLTVTNTTIKGDPTALSSSGNLTVVDSTLTSTRTPSSYDDRVAALAVSGSGITNVTGSTLTGKYGIISSTSGTITLENNTITGNSQQGIYSTGDGTIDIKENTIEGIQNGIYNTGSGTINIGVSDGEVSKVTPSIKGSIGLNNSNVNATINMYDGVLIGTTALNGALTSIESGYSLILETVDGLEHKYLDKVYTVENITSPNHEKYYSVQEGIDHASNGDTLKLLRELTITNSEPSISVGSSKEVTLDLDGYKISAGNSLLFENAGNLTVTSSKVDETTGDIIPGYIESAGSKVVQNTNTISLSNLDIKKVSNNSTDVIYNEGTMTNNNIKVYTGIDGMSSWLIYNNGTIISSNSEYLTYNTKVIYNSATITSTSDKIKVTKEENYDSKINMIYSEATGVMTFNDLDFRHMSRYYPNNSDSYLYYAIENYGEININGGTIREDGSRGYWGDVHSSLFLENKADATASIDGTSFVGSYGIIAHNYGTLDINDITSSFDSAIMNYSGSTATLTNSNLTSISRYSLENSGTLTVDATSITSSGTTISNSANATITDSTLTSTSGSSSSNNITNSGTGTLTIDGDTVITGQIGIGSSGTGNINILSGEINASNYGINNSGAGTITLGVHADGTVSTTNPSIKGNNVGLNNTSSTAVINFYDGLLIGNTAHSGSITNLEDNYEIISETVDGLEHEYLDRTYVMQNITSGTHDKYYTIQDAIDHASVGDTLLLLRKATILPSESTILVDSTKDITIDLNGFLITTNNALFLTNNGKLTITDNTKTTDSVGNGGITSNISQIFENNGTLTFEGGTYLKTLDYTKNLMVNTGKVIVNNGKLTMGNVLLGANLIESSNEIEVNGGEISTYVQTAINSTGKVKVTGGTIKKNSNYCYDYNTSPYEFVDAVIHSSSTGEVTITGGDFTGVERYSSNHNDSGAIIFSDGILNITGGTFVEKGDTHGNSRILGAAVRNGVNGTATITGGTFTSGIAGIIFNQGTATIENITSTYEAVAYNSGTLTLDNCSFTNISNYVNNYNMNGGGISNQGDLTIIGGTYRGSISAIINSANNLSISGTTIQGSGGISISGGTNTISNVTITASGNAIGISNSNTTVNTATITAATTVNSSGGNIELTNITSTNTNTIFNNTGSGVITSNSGTYTTTTNNVLNNTSSGTTILKTGTYTTANGTAITNSGTGTIVIGESGGTPSTTDPYILGTSYGLTNTNNNANIYFYDGIISGQTGSVYGTIRDVEPGYKEVRNPNVIDDVNYTSSTLAPLGEDDVVVVVNNTNFASLQSAVNYAVANEIPTISLQKDYALEADLVKPSGIDVNVYTNGHTLTTTGYTVANGINIINSQAPTGVGGAIYKFLANITGTELNPKNIIIYKMEDGNPLNVEETYKLFRLVDNQYLIINMNEKALGEYEVGGSLEEMNVIKGRLYINNIGEGTYKLVGSDNKEIDFEIYENSVTSNIKINNKVEGKKTSTAFATLILTFGTGIVRTPYVVLILFAIVIILGLIAIKKKKELQE